MAPDADEDIDAVAGEIFNLLRRVEAPLATPEMLADRLDRDLDEDSTREVLEQLEREGVMISRRVCGGRIWHLSHHSGGADLEMVREWENTARNAQGGRNMEAADG